jgi:hypothetical protein
LTQRSERGAGHIRSWAKAYVGLTICAAGIGSRSYLRHGEGLPKRGLNCSPAILSCARIMGSKCSLLRDRHSKSADLCLDISYITRTNKQEFTLTCALTFMFRADIRLGRLPHQEFAIPQMQPLYYAAIRGYCEKNAFKTRRQKCNEFACTRVFCERKGGGGRDRRERMYVCCTRAALRRERAQAETRREQRRSGAIRNETS